MELTAVPWVVSALLSAVTFGVGAAAEAVGKIRARKSVNKIIFPIHANRLDAVVFILVPPYTR